MTLVELCARLARAAEQSSRVQESMAKAKSLRQAGHEPPRDDLYMWPTPEQTLEWQAKAELERLQQRVEVLEGALRPFAECPTKGKNGGRFVIAHAVYTDVGEGKSAPRAAYWHAEHFDKARAALER